MGTAQPLRRVAEDARATETRVASTVSTQAPLGGCVVITGRSRTPEATAVAEPWHPFRLALRHQTGRCPGPSQH